MADIRDRIDFTASPEAVFQNFQIWAVHSGYKFPTMPIYDFGRLLDFGSSDHIGSERFLECSRTYTAWIDETRPIPMPHPFCAFLNRYGATAGDPDYLILAVVLSIPIANDVHFVNNSPAHAVIGWFEWSRRYEWRKMAGAALTAQGLDYGLERHQDQSKAELYRNTHMSALTAGLHLIMTRPDAVDTSPRPPAITRGRTKVHPRAPTNVITIKIDRAKLAQPKPQPVSSSEAKKAVEPHDRAGTSVTYRHPRYKNVLGKSLFRRGAKVNGGAAEPKVYHVER
jgi:hypothetical protein